MLIIALWLLRSLNFSNLPYHQGQRMLVTLYLMQFSSVAVNGSVSQTIFLNWRLNSFVSSKFFATTSITSIMTSTFFNAISRFHSSDNCACYEHNRALIAPINGFRNKRNRTQIWLRFYRVLDNLKLLTAMKNVYVIIAWSLNEGWSVINTLHIRSFFQLYSH